MFDLKKENHFVCFVRLYCFSVFYSEVIQMGICLYKLRAEVRDTWTTFSKSFSKDQMSLLRLQRLTVGQSKLADAIEIAVN